MKEIGQEIQQARLEKGFTLEEIANHTRIQLSHLQKIENGQFDFLPRPYVVAFIKTFAQHVGLNGDLLIKRWRELEQVEAARAQEQPTQQPPHRKGPERRKTAVLTSSPKPMEPYAVPTSYFPYLKEILIGFGMVLVMALLIYLMSKTGGEKTKIEQDNPAQSSQLNQPSRVQEIPFSEVTKEVAAKAQVSIPSV
ncbi:MAG: helix-turn-helix domain-containing protein, partial [candidate division KSB1 bacterium]|nr:helix-turn-helix domain-containing protein [candidate division KSB1 bacterium]